MFSKSRFNPGPGVADFWEYVRQPQPYRWPILFASIVPIGLILWWATGEQVYVPPERPQVTYITSFAPGRSDEEIVASNEANQARKDALAAERAEIEARKRDMYRELGRATGLDVDAMERQIAEERAREEAAKEQTRAGRTTGGNETD